MKNLTEIENVLTFCKTYSIIFLTCLMSLKIMNLMKQGKLLKTKLLVATIIVTIFYLYMKYKIDFLYGIVSSLILLSIIISVITQKVIGFTITTTTISFAINNSIFFISTVISVFISLLIGIRNNIIIVSLSIITYTIITCLTFRIKKFKNGFSFLSKNIDNEYFGIILFNISVIIVFGIILFSNYQEVKTGNIGIIIILFSIIMSITIQKSFQLYYKQKLLEQELNKTKEELANKTKDIENLEAENIEISKKAHTLTHKQKSLAKKIDEMMMNAEISKEEAAEVKDRLNKIGKELYKEKNTVELDKTEIPEIDDMLKFMQSECSANKIDFELQLKGNIHHLTNNLIPKEDLETLLADHIKNAIIAINDTDNINRSILVKLGAIDETYGLYIYDSGVEFEKEILENLGKKPSTTHKDEGGTGMGFMNTFDTLRKCNASLIIEEFNKPDKDNYTKAIKFKFDNKNEFKIKSYRENQMVANSAL